MRCYAMRRVDVLFYVIGSFYFIIDSLYLILAFDNTNIRI